MPRQYITTAIDYPNAVPHMGHVLEKVLADICARWFRLRGDEVRFQIGTDEHGVKIERTAEKEGMTPKALVDRNVPAFLKLYASLNISSDHFIRTTDRAGHWPTVLELWKRLRDAGALEKRRYSGLYCSGCERFMTKRDLTNGKCLHHGAEPEEVSEENWFFLLSRENAWLKDLLTRDGGYGIVPAFRSQETLSLIEQGLDDVSFSRPKASLSWGIPVPGDEEQTMYVWCDALTNYISSLGYFTVKEDRTFWDEAEVTHVIGKDIARFHALYWPAMLKNAGLSVPPPHRLLIHGFLTSEGQKMSKSIGNVVAPEEILGTYGVDPLRFYLSHEVPVGRDGDFSRERFRRLYDSKLRNELGNLLNRVIVLLLKDGGKVVMPSTPLLTDGKRWQEYEDSMNSFDLFNALGVAMISVRECNELIDREKPWEKEGEKKRGILSALTENLRLISLMLLPFIPETAQRMSMQLGVPYAESMHEKTFVLGEKTMWGSQRKWQGVGEPEILFRQLDS